MTQTRLNVAFSEAVLDGLQQPADVVAFLRDLVAVTDLEQTSPALLGSVARLSVFGIGGEGVYGYSSSPDSVRGSAQLALDAVLAHRPNLAEEALKAVEPGVRNPMWDVREFTQLALGRIVRHAPDLAERVRPLVDAGMRDTEALVRGPACQTMQFLDTLGKPAAVRALKLA